jgi:hypothetical protein
VPPCFFVSRVMRSVHAGRILDVAQAAFDGAELVELATSAASQHDRFLVAWTSSSSGGSTPRARPGTNSPSSLASGGDGAAATARARDVRLSNLSLPPYPGEAREWMCWGCLSLRDGRDSKCPLCR